MASVYVTLTCWKSLNSKLSETRKKIAHNYYLSLGSPSLHPLRILWLPFGNSWIITAVEQTGSRGRIFWDTFIFMLCTLIFFHVSEHKNHLFQALSSVWRFPLVPLFSTVHVEVALGRAGWPCLCCPQEMIWKQEDFPIMLTCSCLLSPTWWGQHGVGREPEPVTQDELWLSQHMTLDKSGFFPPDVEIK